MSRAFVKESDGDLPEALPPLPQSPHPNRVTPQGLAQLRARLAQAHDRLATAESAAERARILQQFAWLQARVASAIVVSLPADRSLAGFGASVTVRTEDDATRTYRIVGEDQAAPERGDVSWVSPLARALEGARAGDVVTWSRPVGDVDLEVLAVRYEDGEA